ncbi:MULTISPECIES: hypothetical protein [Staphylococcus]|uniref:Uncharacterized protein n=1 Tax=Staphylococcus ureilyticus TaxID=94138 RepID=A0AB34AK48_STAUR|nr:MULTISPECIES: hypothetical protein [Staphylococcus]AVL76874.1 hypothetical protein CEQ12_03470 [Staphylococcus cohnii]MBL0376298.1 hypothetical protein [Staphylococcus sp. S75]MBL0382915.1 hypothetical protein [Staphylococcus sp. S59]MBL0400595.1 hypothetical protein [Staphylococcus sp. S36]MCT1915108.1 hypothetical protein [Staphylococcus ureilyticus]
MQLFSLTLLGIIFVFVYASNSTILLHIKLIRRAKKEGTAAMNGKQYRFMWCLFAVMATGFYLLLLNSNL